LLFPATARSKEWVCGLSLDGIVGLNPAGARMSVCLSVVVVVVVVVCCQVNVSASG
jgi:hypothetical protein